MSGEIEIPPSFWHEVRRLVKAARVRLERVSKERGRETGIRPEGRP